MQWDLINGNPFNPLATLLVTHTRAGRRQLTDSRWIRANAIHQHHSAARLP